MEPYTAMVQSMVQRQAAETTSMAREGLAIKMQDVAITNWLSRLPAGGNYPTSGQSSAMKRGPKTPIQQSFARGMHLVVLIELQRGCCGGGVAP